MKKLIVGVAVLALVGLASFAGTRAFFSDTEVSTGNAFTAGSLDLKVGIDSNSSRGDLPVRNLDNYNNYALFNFSGLMPGDSDSGFFKLESTQDAWVCMAADIEDENKYMQDHIEFATWVENTPDGKVGPAEVGTLTAASLRNLNSAGWIAVQDKSVNGTALSANDQYEQGFSYCFGQFERNNDGTLVVRNNMPVCDGSGVDNGAQGGFVNGGIHFYAEQARNNPNFMCASLNGDGQVTGQILSVDMTLSAGASYKGIIVETHYDGNFVDAIGMEVDIERADGTHVTKTMRANRVQEYLNSKTAASNTLTTPFPINSTGSYDEAGSSSWEGDISRNANWDENTKPVKLTVTITEADGTVVKATETLGGIDWSNFIN